MKIKLFALASLYASSFAFAQNATSQASTQIPYISPYYPLITSPYLSASLVLLRDITIVVVLCVILFQKFNNTQVKEKGK
ncbi:MAG: hypothetical protein V1909_01140 [Candidatus Micrarchaeota archaeon]